jgi:hypothetical protein
MKIIVALLATALLMACGGKAKKATAPANTSGTAIKTEGTGGNTYGGAQATPAAGEPAPLP